MFNEVQLAHAHKLAQHCRDNGFEVFAPVDEMFLEDQGVLAAQKIFLRNLHAMEKCDSVLAQLDYPMPEGFKNIVRSADQAVEISLPDAGTVFEMGYATAEHIPIIGYYTQKPSKMNLMLTRSLRGVVDNIFEFVNNNQINWSLMKDWKGGEI
jgi:nucleoside 2-deoxyribosyltransferase